MSKVWTAAIAGAGGYVGGELIRLILGHPNLALTAVTSRSRLGEAVSSVFPHFLGRCELPFSDERPQALADRVDVLFLALPHGASMAAVEAIFAGGQPKARIIDMSGDYRLDDPETYAKFYKTPHTSPALMGQFVYGLTEWMGSQIREARCVANPGCFATAVGLALAPLASAGMLPERVTVFAATGSTGSGNTPKRGTHHPERASNYKLYKVLGHQHTPEILGMLRALGTETALSFVPASAPMTHGIFATCHVLTDRPAEAAEAIREAYATRPFVRVREGSPQLNWVIGSNYADIGLFEGDGELVVACALDNTIKGAAGQAIQNLNLMLGLEETAGLGTFPSLP